MDNEAALPHNNFPVWGFLIAAVFTALVVIYIYRRLFFKTEFPLGVKIIAILFPFAGMIGNFLIFGYTMRMSKGSSFSDVPLMFSSTFFSFILVLFFLLVFHDLLMFIFMIFRAVLIKIINWKMDKDKKVHAVNLTPEGRTVKSIVLLSLAFILFLVGFYQAVCQSPYIEREIFFSKTNNSKYLKIAHLSDLHLGTFTGKKWFSKVIRNVNQYDPDLICITGDFADNRADQREDVTAMLKQFKAPVCYVSGNHEIIWGYQDWIRAVARNRVLVLDGKRTIMNINGKKILVAGIKDIGRNAWYFKVTGVFKKLLVNAPKVDMKILLSHRPEILPSASKEGYDLVLAGHTHDGQSLPFKLFARLLTPYPKGFYKEGKTILFVSPGAGFVGVPLRLGVPKEITFFKLYL
ncbi:MAG: metallophosphoesterase [Spirochaetes bacterium]|nr:metallophosphoesterase [Spirochaetota bacterium]